MGRLGLAPSDKGFYFVCVTDPLETHRFPACYRSKFSGSKLNRMHVMGTLEPNGLGWGVAEP